MDMLDKNNLFAELIRIDLLYQESVFLEYRILNIEWEKEEKEHAIAQPKNKTGSLKRKLVKAFVNDNNTVCVFKVLIHHSPWRWYLGSRDVFYEKDLNKSYSPKSKKKFYDACREYDKAFLSMAAEYKEKYKVEEERYQAELEKYHAEVAAVDSQYKKELEELLQKKNEISRELDNVTIISQDFIPDAGKIAIVIKQGRADTLKEAINLVCDENRKNAEELERREEAERQEKILREQAYENRKHNEAMLRAAEDEARARKEHDAAMERAAQAQADILRKSEETQRRAALARCNSCANRFSCSNQKKQAYSCSSYRSI